jgi:hypothetical protein
VHLRVGEQARAARCLCFEYDDEVQRDRACHNLLHKFQRIEEKMQSLLTPDGGRLSLIEPYRAQRRDSYRLYLMFIADFEQLRGHAAISKAVGSIKTMCTELLAGSGLPPRQCFIAQGFDGDLKPSVRNVRGRYAMAWIEASLDELQTVCSVDPTTLLDFSSIDEQGARLAGTMAHTGAGGEILAGLYRAVKINPHSQLVSSTQRIEARIDGDRFLYSVEMPNIEGGLFSTREGCISPVGREAIRFIGLESSREFAAWAAGVVLAAEFNLAVEIARQRLYRPPDERA